MTIVGFVHDATNLRRPRGGLEAFRSPSNGETRRTPCEHLCASMKAAAGMVFDATGSYIVTSSQITNSLIMVFIGASGSRVTSPTVAGFMALGPAMVSGARDPIVDGNIAARRDPRRVEAPPEAYLPGANSDSIVIFDISSPPTPIWRGSYSSTDIDNVQALAAPWMARVCSTMPATWWRVQVLLYL